MAVIENVFDLWNVFGNELVGDPLILYILVSIVIMILLLRANMSWKISSMFIVLWTGIFFAQANAFVSLWLMIGLGSGFLFYSALYKFNKR